MATKYKKLVLKDFSGGEGQDLSKDLSSFFSSDSIFYDPDSRSIRLRQSFDLEQTFESSDFSPLVFEFDNFLEVSQNYLVVPIVNSSFEVEIWRYSSSFSKIATFPTTSGEIYASFLFKSYYVINASTTSGGELFYSDDIGESSPTFSISELPFSTFSQIRGSAVIEDVLYITNGYEIYSTTNLTSWTLQYSTTNTFIKNIKAYSGKLFVLEYINDSSLFRFSRLSNSNQTLSFLSQYSGLLSLEMSVFQDNFLLILSYPDSVKFYSYDLNSFTLLNILDLSSRSTDTPKFQILSTDLDHFFYFTIDEYSDGDHVRNTLYQLTSNFSLFKQKDFVSPYYSSGDNSFLCGYKYFSNNLFLYFYNETDSKIYIFKSSTTFLTSPAFLKTSAFRFDSQVIPKQLILRHSPLPANVKISVFPVYDDNAFARSYNSPVIENSVPNSIISTYTFPSNLSKNAISFKITIEKVTSSVTENVTDIQLDLIYVTQGLESLL